MSAERNFNDYILGDNVYELAGGLIPEIAETLDIEIGSEPTSEVLGSLVGKLGTNKVLRENETPLEISQGQAVEWVERSAVQEPLARSLWTPEIPIGHLGVMEATIVTGGVANWMDRTARLVTDFSKTKSLVAATGSREMGSPADKKNPNIAAIMNERVGAPLEAEYQARIMPAGTELHSFSTTDGAKIAEQLVERRGDLFEPGSQIAFARVANAGIQLACQFRAAARTQYPDFDTDPERPQVYVLTDGFPIAETAEQIADSRSYQSPYTALRQVALTAKMLHEASN